MIIYKFWNEKVFNAAFRVTIEYICVHTQPIPRHCGSCPFACWTKIEKVQRVPPVEAKNLHVNPHKKIAIFNFEKLSPGFSGVTRQYAHQV